MAFYLLVDGFSVLTIFWKELLILSLSGVGLGTLFIRLLFREEKQIILEILLVFLGFSIVGVLMTLLKFFGIFRFALVVSIFGVGVLSFLAWGKSIIAKYGTRKSLRCSWFPSTLFLFFLIIRLGFIKNLLLPPYFDSPIHFSIIKFSLSPDIDNVGISRIIDHYYHLGFHGIVAWVSMLTNNFAPNIMALVGQFFLALLPVSVYLFVLSLTNSILAGSVSAMLAGFGWNMPSYAANWGKYPAIVGIVLLPVFWGIFYIAIQEKRLKLNLLCVFAAISLTWIHSRIIILIFFFVIIYVLLYFLKRNSSTISETLWIISLFSLIFIFPHLFAKWIDNGYFRFYLETFGGTTYLILLLLFFAFYKYPEFSLQMFFFSILLMLGTAISIPNPLQGYSYILKTIDKPFFEISFFLPLAVLGGLGVESLRDILGGKRTEVIIIGISSLFLLINAVLFFSFTPIDKTNYVRDDDLFALFWIKEKLPTNSKVIIAGEKHISSWGSSDAGGWVNVLTNREIYNLEYDFNWRSETDIQKLCQNLDSSSPYFIYVGSTLKRFDFYNATNTPWIEYSLYFPDTQIYQLHCQ